jgi:hypothetical protein
MVVVVTVVVVLTSTMVVVVLAVVVVVVVSGKRYTLCPWGSISRELAVGSRHCRQKTADSGSRQ